MCWAQNADIHALKQHRLFRNSSPICSSFRLVIVSDMHLEPESEKQVKNCWFSHYLKCPKTSTTVSLFLDEFLSRELKPVYCSLTTQHSPWWKTSPHKDHFQFRTTAETSCFIFSRIWTMLNDIGHDRSRDQERGWVVHRPFWWVTRLKAGHKQD